MTQTVRSVPAVPAVPARRTVAKRIVALHYPSVYAPPVGVWWWDEASSGLRHYYLDGHADISQALAKDLAGVASGSEWQPRLSQLRQRTSVSVDRMRTVTTSVWSPVDVLLTTISHWSLCW
jgi:hypothetical protein